MTSKRGARQGLRSSLLDCVRNDPRDTWVSHLSKRKVRVRRGNQSLVLRESDPLVAQILKIVKAYHKEAREAREAARAIKEEAALRAMRLLHEIVQKHACLRIIKDELIVESANGRRYAITIERGYTYRLSSKKRRYVCVTIPYSFPNAGLLPLADCIIAKALTIAYAPYLINTL